MAEFFSFGTNDLTQTTLGVSRDDAARFLIPYVEKEIYPKDPFEVLDRTGVGALMKMAVEKGRGVRPDLKVGICGEHGGEPSSVEFCHQHRPELRELLAVPGADRAAGGGAGGAGGCADRRRKPPERKARGTQRARRRK